ncbi:MAG: hypothetical protein QXP38_06220 [Nitrososphaerota archaeon]
MAPFIPALAHGVFLRVKIKEEAKRSAKILRELRDGIKSTIIKALSIHSIIVIMDGLDRLNALKTFF